MKSTPAAPTRRPPDLSTILFIGMHLSLLGLLFVPLSWPLLALAMGGYLLRMWGITAGYHRYFSHRSFKTSRAFQFVLALVGLVAMQNGPIWWASWHRRHHKHSDTPRDPHSPVTRGFWHAHLGWIFEPASEAPDLGNVKDLTRYPELVWLDRHKWVAMVAYALGCYALLGVPGVLWGFVVSTLLAMHCTMLINSLAHVWGTRRFPTKDHSRNNALLAVLTLGEGWHNNHHFCMSSARQGFLWWEVDPTYYSLRLLAMLGVVWDLRPPSAAALLQSSEAPGPAALGAVGARGSIPLGRRPGLAPLSQHGHDPPARRRGDSSRP